MICEKAAGPPRCSPQYQDMIEMNRQKSSNRAVKTVVSFNSQDRMSPDEKGMEDLIK